MPHGKLFNRISTLATLVLFKTKRSQNRKYFSGKNSKLQVVKAIKFQEKKNNFQPNISNFHAKVVYYHPKINIT